MSLLKRSLAYLGLLEDDLEEELLSHPAPSTVRRIPRDQHPPAPPVAAPHPPVEITKPSSRDDAQLIGDKLRAGRPVIVDLRGTDDNLARWLADFACGLVYGRDGHVDRLARRMYLLVPPHVSVSAEDRLNLAARVMRLG